MTKPKAGSKTARKSKPARRSGAARRTKTARQGRGQKGGAAARPASRRGRDVAPIPGADGPSSTAVAGEALRTGVVPAVAVEDEPEIPGREGDTIRIGDPDVSALDNEYSGEEAPGSTTPTPDQNDIDEIGKAYGVEDEDTGALVSSNDLLEGRDRRRRSGNG
jgi:hypothetical protein